MKRGGGILNKIINRLPMEMHLPGHQFTGPGTQLLRGKTRLYPNLTYKPWSKPINKVDQAAYHHDVCYLRHPDTKARNEICDREMLEELDAIENPTLRERFDRAIVKPIIKAKKSFGMGMNDFYCVKCKAKTKSKNLTQTNSKNKKLMMRSICAICGSKKCTFIKKKKIDLEQVYYDPETGYCGMNELQRRTGCPKRQLTDFLHGQDVYTKHKPLIYKFRRRRIYVSHVDDQWQADLIDMKSFKRFNNKISFILTVIDIFSKYAWAVPIRKKTGAEITEAFKSIFVERKPEKIQTDKGTEFVNRETQKLFKDNHIQWFTTENVEIKCAVVERFNRTLKDRMWRYFTAVGTQKWIDVLPHLIRNYNHSYHRSIRMTPVEASLKENQAKVHNNLFKIKRIDLKPTFKLNDRVRISKYKTAFKKGYLPTFTEEIFVVSEVLKTDPITYRIKAQDGEEILGTFYKEELVKIKNGARKN